LQHRSAAWIIDVGATHVKFRLSDNDEVRRFRSGPMLTAEHLVRAVLEQTTHWNYDVVSIGYPGAVGAGVPIREPGNLSSGWVGDDFIAAFERPVRLVNDAILQALGAYRGGRMLFLGLGTGIGSARARGRQWQKSGSAAARHVPRRIA